MNEMVFRPMQPENAFSEAVKHLQGCGCQIETTNIPGLTVVDGRELTMAQVKDLARQKGWIRPIGL